MNCAEYIFGPDLRGAPSGNRLMDRFVPRCKGDSETSSSQSTSSEVNDSRVVASEGSVGIGSGASVTVNDISGSVVSAGLSAADKMLATASEVANNAINGTVTTAGAALYGMEQSLKSVNAAIDTIGNVASVVQGTAVGTSGNNYTAETQASATTAVSENTAKIALIGAITVAGIYLLAKG